MDNGSTRVGSMEKHVPLDTDEILFIRSTDGVIGVVKSGCVQQLFIETFEDEIVMAISAEDLLVASGFSNDGITTKAIVCTLSLIRDAGSPLIVLPKDHPASSRLRVVASGKAHGRALRHRERNTSRTGCPLRSCRTERA